MVGRVATVANQALVLRNWAVGAYIVEFEQNGAHRAKYGARLLPTLAADLAAKGVKGLGLTTLKMCRLFSLTYPSIGQPVVDQLGWDLPVLQISRPVVDHFGTRVEGQKVYLSAKEELEAPRPVTGSVSAGNEFRGPADPELPTPLECERLARIS
jgi:hypothetical protein